MVYGILFQLLRLQVLGESVPIKDNHLVQYLIPVPVTLRPFFDHVSTGKIEHFFQCSVAGKYTFCFRHLSVLAVEPLYDIRGIHDAPDIIGELEEGADVFPVVFPVADRIGIFLSPFLFDFLKLREGRRLIGGIVYGLEIGGKLLQVTVIDIFE